MTLRPEPRTIFIIFNDRDGAEVKMAFISAPADTMMVGLSDEQEMKKFIIHMRNKGTAGKFLDVLEEARDKLKNFLKED